MSVEHSNQDEMKLEETLNLGRDFPPPGSGDWRAEAEAALKGAAFDKKLVTQTYEGIDLQPIYTPEDIRDLPHLKGAPGYPPYGRGSRAAGYLGRSWDICQEIPYAEPEKFNEALKYDLQRGQTAVNLQLDRASRLGLDSDTAQYADVGRQGTAISHIDDLDTALADIDLEKFPLYIDTGFSALEMSILFRAWLVQKRIDPRKIKGSIEADPLGFLAAEGMLPVSLTTVFDHMAESAGWAVRSAPALKTIGVGGLPYREAGASAVQELAFALATAVEYINRMMDRGMAPADISGQIRFTFGIGSAYFMEVAKLRAARICWSRIMAAYGGDERSRRMTIHAKTCRYNKTVWDPYVNMLRTTTEGFAAVIGGADSIHTGSFDESMRQPDEFSRRTARNMQIILSEEAHLDRPIDPAGGSYYVETLTHRISRRAWNLFQDIQKRGGMAEALAEGFPQREIYRVAARHLEDTVTRKRVIVGINMYADLKEAKPESRTGSKGDAADRRVQYLERYKVGRIPDEYEPLLESLSGWEPGGPVEAFDTGTEAFMAGATIGEVAVALRGAKQPAVTVDHLHPFRTALLFEDLREAAVEYKDKTGTRPKIFLANLGPPSQHKARADFSRSFFETGGFEVIYPTGFDTPEAAVEAAIRSSAPVTAICSTDDSYPEVVGPIAAGIKEKRPEAVILLAGRPGGRLEQYRQAGVDEFIYLGADARQVITDLFNRIGVWEQ